MSSKTEKPTHDAQSSKPTLAGATAGTAQRSLFQRIIHLFLSFNVDRKAADENNHQHAQLVLSTFFIYMIFVTNVLIVAMLTQSSHSFLITNSFEHQLLRAPFPVKAKWLEREKRYTPYKTGRRIYAHAYTTSFNRITTFQDVWQFMNETVANVFYRSDSRDAQEQHRIRWVLDHFLTIGVVRMRQVRVKAEACNVPKTYADEFAECYPSYNTKTKDKDPFGPITLSDSTHLNLKQAWRYMSDDETGMDSYSGRYGTYEAGGYVADLAQYERTAERFVKDLTELERFHWLDRATRALFIDAVMYNPSMNLFSHIQLMFEMPLTGGIFPSHKIENRQLFRYIGTHKYALIFCEATIVVFTIIFFFMELVVIFKSGWKLFLSFWNCIDLALLVISILLIVANIYRIVIINWSATHEMSVHRSTFDAPTVKLLRVQGQFDTLSILMTSISLIRILKYCDFALTLIRIKATIQRCLGDLLGFLIMFVAIMIAYAQFGNLVLGRQAPAYATIGKAFIALVRTVLSDFDYADIRDAAPVVGPLFFFLYIFSMVFMLFNMVLAIIVDSYEELGTERRDVINHMLIDVAPFIKHSIQRGFERLGMWTRVKVIVQFFIRADDSANMRSIRALLQEFKYSAASSSVYDELRRAFAADVTRSISKKDFDAFLKYAQNDKERQRETLQSLFVGNKSLVNVKEEQAWNQRATDLCTMQQWAQLRYRTARLEELLYVLEGKFLFSLRTSENLRRTVTLPLESPQPEENV